MENLLYSEVHLICIIIVSLEIIQAIKSIDKSPGMRLFVICFAFIDLSFVFNLLLWFAENSGRPVLLVPARQLYYLFFGLGAFTWFVYSEYQFSQKRLGKKQIVLAALPFLLAEVLMLSSIGFSVDALAKQETMQLISLGVGCGYMAASGARACVKAFNKKNYLKKDEYLMIGLFALVALVCAFLQILIKVPVPLVIEGTSLCVLMQQRALPLVCAGETICAVLLYQKHQEKLISRDPLTGITNRIQLVQYLSNKMNNHTQSLYLIMMDINGLKKINETYGHAQGDAALIQVADALKETVPRNFLISRYGGDEFVIAGEISTEEQILIINEGIRRNVARRNDANGRNWNVSVCIGFAKYTQTMTCVSDFLSEAYASLCAAKKSQNIKN